MGRNNGTLLNTENTGAKSARGGELLVVVMVVISFGVIYVASG